MDSLKTCRSQNSLQCYDLFTLLREEDLESIFHEIFDNYGHELRSDDLVQVCVCKAWLQVMMLIECL